MNYILKMVASVSVSIFAHIDKKRKALGIDKSRERKLVDMASRREMAA